MTKEKKAVLQFNLARGRFAKWRIRRLIRKNKNYSSLLVKFSDKYLFIIAANAGLSDGGAKEYIVVKSPESKYYDPGEIIRTFRHFVEVTESDIV